MSSEKPISDFEIRALRLILIEKRHRLVLQVAGLDSMHTELLEVLVQEVPDDEHDPDGTTAFERAQVRSLASDARSRLAELDSALALVDEDGFGRCVTCGMPIGIERLTARPESVRCVTCSASGSVWRLGRRT